MDRRTFTLSSLAATGAMTTASVFAKSSKPKVGLIGCGWFGRLVLDNMGQLGEVECISLCDPNSHATKLALEEVAKHQKSTPRLYRDYREMLAKTKHDIVIVSTPDHWHALPAIAAMKAGADVFLEKPISVDVIEGEALVAAARKYERVVQVNTQRRSTALLAQARDKYLRSGKLGTVAAVETYSYISSRSKDDMPQVEAPAHLDYEMWTGPAPLLPFRTGIDSRAWRSFIEYGNGQIGDLGIHMFDVARWMLDLEWPSSISSVGGIYIEKASPSNVTDTQRSQFRYPGLDVSWEHRTWGVAAKPQRHWTDLWGARFIGERGTLDVTTLGYLFTPRGEGASEGVHMLSASGDQQNLDDSRLRGAMGDIQKAHIQDFLRARDTRSRPIADIEQGHISTACCILANLALELGRPLSYDPKSKTVTDDAEATRKLARQYRQPWVHPTLDNI